MITKRYTEYQVSSLQIVHFPIWNAHIFGLCTKVTGTPRQMNCFTTWVKHQISVAFPLLPIFSPWSASSSWKWPLPSPELYLCDVQKREDCNSGLIIAKLWEEGNFLPEGTHQPPQADSAQQQQGVQQWQISAGHSSKHSPPRHGSVGNLFFLKIITNRVVVKLADELMSREAFTHQDVNLLLGRKQSSAL